MPGSTGSIYSSNGTRLGKLTKTLLWHWLLQNSQAWSYSLNFTAWKECKQLNIIAVLFFKALNWGWMCDKNSSSKYLDQQMHNYIHWVCLDFPPVCNLRWVVKLLFWLEAKLHLLHLLDFSPLCAITCLLKLLSWMNAEPHWLHLNSSPVCVLMCIFNAFTQEDAYSHWLHLWSFSSECILLWFFKSV